MSFMIILSVLFCLYFMSVECLFVSLLVLLVCEIILHKDRFRVHLFPGAGVYIYFLLSGTVIGIYHLLTQSYAPKYVLKDIVYALFPFIFWLIGKNAARQKEISFTNLFIAGVVVSFYDFASSLFLIFSNGAFEMSLYQFRHMIGAGHPLTLFTLFWYIFMPQKIMLKKKQAYGCVSLLLVDLLIHFSRINLLNAFVFLLCLKLLKNPVKIFQYGTFIVIGLTAAYGMFPSIFDSYVERLANSLTEISHVRESWDHVAIVTNWRGYEVYCELKKFRNACMAEKIFGGGFGAQLDVEGNAYLVTTEETLPFLHNGYFSILMIWGIWGCVAYIMMLLLLYLKNRTLAENRRGLWKAFVLVIALDTLVVHGMFFSTSVAGAFLYLAILDDSGGAEEDGCGDRKTAQRFS